ncbi:uncharacterized protein LOC132737666 [Ruditapes philippinarum]|uniref:uncharacterized protein LOC132737666 n=1 Tax=Ruditapes philippinarum TaxID=129788 RepID=UPI00295A684A|nr:uncharacterized protein LOC132737666 [Ruditapes philippinarum]
MAESGNKNTRHDAVPGRVEEILCQPCLNKDKHIVADKFCSTCNEYQCTDCSNVHSILPILKSHKLVNTKEIKAKQCMFDMKGLDQCDQHHKLLEFFCEDDDQLCCSTCAIVDHRKCHSVVEVQKIAGKFTSQGSSLKGKWQEVKENAEYLVKSIISSKGQVQLDAKEIHGTIRHMRDRVIEMFEDLEASIVEKVEDFKTETIAEFDKKQTKNEGYVVDATQNLEIIKNVYKNGTSVQQFIVEKKMQEDAKNLVTKVNAECQNLETVIISFEFDDTLNVSLLPLSGYVPGKLTLKLEAKKMKLTPVISIDLKQNEDEAEKPLCTGFDFLLDGRLVAVDNKNKKCLVYNENLEKVGSYQLSYHPKDVVAISEDIVAVTSGDCYKIDFLKVSDENEITLDKTCKVNTMYYSICLKDKNHFIAGTLKDLRHVRIVSSSGEEKDLNVTFPNKMFSINASACTFIETCNKIIITERYENTVNIYDIKTKTRVEVKDDQIQRPCGVATGPSDTILVCCGGTHGIVQISLTGQILSSHKIGMESPWQICVSRSYSFVAITNSLKGDRKLQKFKVKQYQIIITGVAKFAVVNRKNTKRWKLYVNT